MNSLTVMERMCYIYSLEHPHTSEIRYIGKCDDLKKRLSLHLKENDIEYKRNTKKNLWIKYLQDRDIIPKMEIVDVIPHREWKFWEQHYISLYRYFGYNLTNSTIGGDGGEMSEDVKKKIYEKTRKKILQYDRDGNFVKQWNSLTEATRYYKTSFSVIWNALNKVRPTAKNSLWEYKLSENYPLKIKSFTSDREKMPKVILGRKKTALKLIGKKPSKETLEKIRRGSMGKISPRRKKICQYDLNGNLIKEWNYIELAVKESQVPRSQIFKCLNGKIKSDRGFIFKYKKTAILK